MLFLIWVMLFAAYVVFAVRTIKKKIAKKNYKGCFFALIIIFLVPFIDTIIIHAIYHSFNSISEKDNYDIVEKVDGFIVEFEDDFFYFDPCSEYIDYGYKYIEESYLRYDNTRCTGEFHEDYEFGVDFISKYKVYCRMQDYIALKFETKRIEHIESGRIIAEQKTASLSYLKLPFSWVVFLAGEISYVTPDVKDMVLEVLPPK